MAFSTSAPKHITWLICLVLYIVALAAAFGGVAMDSAFALWSWVIGFGLLLIATVVKDL
ncbi:MAG TPA: hypothetical protein VMO26_10205 [Vicinamibacterales bacterium]|nr:hypothetical protein [Vicinamibacterales bacterium]